MKKIIIALLLLTNTFTGANAIENIVSQDDIEQAIPQPVETIVVESQKSQQSFDWLELNEQQRNDRIQQIRELLFENNSSAIYYTKDEFKKKFANFYKDREFKYHYMVTNNGVEEDENAKYCAFYFKRGTLVMYAIQYKDNPQTAYYYSAYGKLFYTDLMSKEYPNYPYTSMQYDRKGQLKSAIYFVGKDLQYMFSPDKNFEGVWYKDKMYDINGKEISTRKNW